MLITTGEIREFQPSVFGLMLEPCSAMVLPHVLNVDMPCVWLASHTPNPYLEWWRAEVSPRKDGDHHSVEMRSMSFDVQLPTKDFLALLSEFVDCGMSVLKVERKMPPTLCPQYLKEDSRYKILV